MSYNSKEASPRAGEQIEMVRFSIGVDDVYRYTTALEDQTFAGEVYPAATIDRGAPTLSPEIGQNTLTFTLPSDAVLPALFKVNAPRQSVFVAVFRKHAGAPDSEVVSYWQGEIEGVRFKGETAEITCSSLETLLHRAGLRYLYEFKCRYFFCDGRCPVPASAVTFDVLIQSANNVQLSSPTFGAFEDGYFEFGEITTPDFISLMVIKHIGDTVWLIAPFHTAPVGLTVKALAGCDYTQERCIAYGEWTDNGRAYGGENGVPAENLFEKGLR